MTVGDHLRHSDQTDQSLRGVVDVDAVLTKAVQVSLDVTPDTAGNPLRQFKVRSYRRGDVVRSQLHDVDVVCPFRGVADVEPALVGREGEPALGYPMADVLVLAVAARFFLGSHSRGPVSSWLAGTVIVMLCADTMFALLNFFGPYQTGHPIDALILSYNLGWGAVALHPHSSALSHAVVQTAPRPSWARLGALTAASLIAPVVLVVQVLSHQYADVLVTAGASAAFFLLVVARMGGVVRTLESVLAQRQALETELAHRADHDDLTGLANRRVFTANTQSALTRQRQGGTKVLDLDLDRFKAVNDSLGHSAGDTLLTVTAHRLQAVLEPADTIARLGGDEFAVLLSDPHRARSLSHICTQLQAALAKPIPLNGLDLQVTASIGTAPGDGGDRGVPSPGNGPDPAGETRRWEVLPARAAAPRAVGDWAEVVHGNEGRPHVFAPVDERRRPGREVGPRRRGQRELHRPRHQKRRLLPVTQITPTPCPHVAPLGRCRAPSTCRALVSIAPAQGGRCPVLAARG